ncbi:hypothetical protein AB9P05_21705 [Roseivirga sp. BDSF3-8]|uniref:hypothetical protein n=1 Tax=Roseivirga sp. BDSF3-8 TaxID=3241598 RepID=UPI0035327B77
MTIPFNYSGYMIDKLLLTLPLFIFANCGMSSQDNHQDTPAGLAQISGIQDIKEEFSTLTSLRDSSRLLSVAVPYKCYEESGTVTYYYQGTDLRIITHDYHAGGHYSANNQYYLHNDSLFFAILEEATWMFDSQGGQGATRDDISQHRYYFVNNEPVRCLRKKYSLYSYRDDNPAAENVPNEEVECDQVANVRSKYHTLIAYKDGTNRTRCIEE